MSSLETRYKRLFYPGPLFDGTPVPIAELALHVDPIAEVFYNVNYSIKNSTVDCKYLLFLQDFFFRLKPKQYKKCQYS